MIAICVTRDMQKKKKKIITGPITNGSDVLNNILICHYRQFSPHYVSFEIAFGKIHEENQKQKKNRISNYRFCSTTPYKFMRCHKPKIRARHIYFSYKLCYTSNDFHTDFQFRFNFFFVLFSVFFAQKVINCSNLTKFSHYNRFVSTQYYGWNDV